MAGQAVAVIERNRARRRQEPASIAANRLRAVPLVVLPLLFGSFSAISVVSAASPSPRRTSAFYPPELIVRARENVKNHPWAAAIQKPVIAAAQPWMKLSDDQLWGMMFGNTIKRSWMVWSNGYCPACRKDVPMYNWEMNPFAWPWKTRCPHCRELFPKNDFRKFYNSGLDEKGVFDPRRADRSLLFNTDHPDAGDPLHMFGVDDGDGFVQDGRRWRFIGAYLIYGQWKKAVVAGVSNLAAAYAVTGDRAYAHKAAVMLDRIADIYPTFDFRKEGILYEGPSSAGYVSTWHDACVEVRDLAMAYDQIVDEIDGDTELVAFLKQKADRFQPPLPKGSVGDVCANIEQRIFQDTLQHRQKIESNYPQTDMTTVIIKTVLNWPDNRQEVMGLLDGMVDTATAVDGVSGEKGMDGYARIAPNSIAELLGRYMRVDRSFLKEMLARHRRLHSMFRFHLDTWCLGRYYPRIGDTGSFAAPNTTYAGVIFSRNRGLDPSAYTFLWDLYSLTKDADFVRALYKANGSEVTDLPHDLFSEDPARLQKDVQRVVAEKGIEIVPPSVNKQQWRLAILRSGRGVDARAVWLDYDSGERHGHCDAMNLGLFASGLDLLPDFGYPPVNFGGWDAPRAVWYTRSAAHNTVLVDGKDSVHGGGKTTLWADGTLIHAVRASAPALVGAKEYERTVVLVDVSPQHSYVVDIFRAVGGKEHLKLLHGTFGTMQPFGLKLAPAEAPPLSGPVIQMRGFQHDRQPSAGWGADWKVEDRFSLRPADTDARLRCTELTRGAEAFTAESWVNAGGFKGDSERWIPTVLVRRQAQAAPLESTFVSVFEPYETRSAIREVRRIPLEGDAGRSELGVGIEIALADGSRDLILAAAGSGAPAAVKTNTGGIMWDGALALVRRDAEGKAVAVAIAGGSRLEQGDLRVAMRKPAELVEMSFDGEHATLGRGTVADVDEIRVGQRKLAVR